MIILQKILPRRWITKIAGRLANSQLFWLKTLLIWGFAKWYRINLEEAQLSQYQDYPSFNAFFTRKLKKESRPIDKNPNGIACPADGFIYAWGETAKKPVFNAKGFEFSLSELFMDINLAEELSKGYFFCIYLSPRDYHRVHMPITAKLLQTLYIPGDCYSVNPKILQAIPAIFSKNERVISSFNSDFGKVVIVMIGAMNVASCHTVWAGPMRNINSNQKKIMNYNDDHISLMKGEEMGHFQMGSTVMVFSTNKLNFIPLKSGQPCLMGQKIAIINQ